MEFVFNYKLRILNSFKNEGILKFPATFTEGLSGAMSTIKGGGEVVDNDNPGLDVGEVPERSMKRRKEAA